jgi:hypothetical protein
MPLTERQIDYQKDQHEEYYDKHMTITTTNFTSRGYGVDGIAHDWGVDLWQQCM